MRASMRLQQRSRKGVPLLASSTAMLHRCDPVWKVMEINRLLIPKSALILLILSPLVYCGPGYSRLPAAFVIAMASCSLFFLDKIRLRLGEIFFVLLYATVLMIQIDVIPGVWFKLAAGHALCMVAMFLPAWAIYSSHIHLKNLESAALRSMHILFVVTIVSIYLSYFFMIGDIIHAGDGVIRAFAWLGDRYTPMIVFLLLFFAFQRRKLHVAALFGALLMTGGKSGMLLLGVAPLVYAIVVPMPNVKRVCIICGVTLMVLAVYASWNLISSTIIPGSEIAYNSRMLANKVGLNYFRENPWFGIGISLSTDATEINEEYIIKTSGLKAYTMPRIHNAFLRTAAETGAFGLVALLGLCSIWVLRSMGILARSYRWRPSPERSLVIAGTLWTICFVLFYQTVDWFMMGENQLAWLLMISAVSEAVYRRTMAARTIGLSGQAAKTRGAPVFSPQKGMV